MRIMNEPNPYHDSSSIIKSCYIFNKTFNNVLDDCDKENTSSCFQFWDIEEAEHKNLTQIVETSNLTLKDCWKGHGKLEKDYCQYKKSLRKLMCFCNRNNCNRNDKPSFELIKDLDFQPNSTTPKQDQPSQTNQSQYLIYFIPLLLVIFLLFYYFYKQRNGLSKKFCMNQPNNIKQNHLTVIETQEPLIKKTTTPKIIQHLKQGQYGNVYKGKIERQSQSTDQLVLIHEGQQTNQDQEQTVAVKVYPKGLYESFKHEYNVYNLPHFKHKNILKLISSEEKLNSTSYPGYWLVLEYYENGSLYDYLKYNLVSYSQLLDICLNIASGLSHLHYNVSCAVVHRDLKSKNILLKSDLTACISDFNLALILHPNQQPAVNLDQVGTVRYMSPEILDCAIQFSKESLMKIDIYSTSLIFWEVLSRCSSHSEPSKEYIMPYDELKTPLTKELLRQHVSVNKQRPLIPDTWCDYEGLKEFAKTINDSWDHDAEARLTASGIVERLKRIKDSRTIF